MQNEQVSIKSKKENSMDTDVLNQYVEKEWKLIPLRKNSKKPIQNGWIKGDITPEEGLFSIKGNGGNCNIGLLLGGNVIDIDLDCPEAELLGRALLPATATFGKADRRTHYLYTVSPEVDAELRQTDQIGAKGEWAGKGAIIEFRGINQRQNHTQTMIPPSVHQDTERELQWFEGVEEIATLSATELKALRRTVRLIAASAIIMRRWSEGNRQDLSMAYTGFLLKGGINEVTVCNVMDVLCRGDEEEEARLLAVERTIERFRENPRDVSGISMLNKILADVDLKQINELVEPIAINLETPELNNISWADVPEYGKVENPASYFVAIDRHQKLYDLISNSVKDRSWITAIYNNQLGKDTYQQIFDSSYKVQDYGYMPGQSLICKSPIFEKGSLLEKEVDCLNLWRAPMTPSVKGDIEPFRKHIYSLVDGREEEAEQILMWLAHIVQNRDINRKADWCLLLLGGQGSGKSVLAEVIMPRVLGEPNVSTQKAEEIETNFNEFMANKQLVCFEEVADKKRSLMDTLKQWITAKKIAVNIKYGARMEVLNWTNLIMTSNHTDALSITDRDRRIFVAASDTIYMTPKRVREQIEPWYQGGRYFQWLESGGYSNIKHYLESRSLDGFNPKKLPRSAGNEQLIQDSKDDFTKFLERFPDEVLLNGVEVAKLFSENHNDIPIKDASKRLQRAGYKSFQARKGKINKKVFTRRPELFNGLKQSEVAKMYLEQQPLESYLEEVKIPELKDIQDI